MVNEKYLRHIGLTEEQVRLLADALRRESRYREILLQEGVHYKVVEKVVRMTDMNEVDLDDEDLLRIKIRAEWEPLSYRK